MIQPRRPAVRVIVLGLAGLGPGCALAPKSQLDACHKLCRSLQAETSQLKDEAVGLRAHNQDLAQRAVADSRRIEELERDNQRLGRSIAAYQEEREQLAASFERMKRQIEAAADPLPTALLRRFEDFARDHTGCEFDPEALVLILPADLLFRAGTDQWAPAAPDVLGETAALLADPAAPDLNARVVGHAAVSPVRLASGDDGPPPGRSLSGARALLVRNALRDRAGIDPARIVAEDAGTTEPRDDPRIAIHLGRIPPMTNDQMTNDSAAAAAAAQDGP